MSSISGIDIVTGLLIPVVLYLIKKVIDWTGKVVGNPDLNENTSLIKFLRIRK